MSDRAYSAGWLTAAIVTSAALVISAPFIGQLRTAIRQASGGNFAAVIASAIAITVGVAIIYAVVRVRERRGMRYAALAAALIIGLAYGYFARTGNPEVDAVEGFHFIEYGIVTMLFYRAWKPADDLAALAMPVLSGLIVGTCEEWLQWFVPARVGEARDVLLNLFAIGCGLLFSIGIDPPGRLTLTLGPRSRRQLGLLGAVALIVFGAFFHSVHLGHEIKDPEAGVFRSRYSADELAAIGEVRSRRWKTNPPLTWSRLSQEDQYFSEGVSHVRRRNETWAEGNVMASRHENLILEKYYAPVLDTPSYVSAQGHRWPPAQRAEAEARIGPGFVVYVSDGTEYPIFIWPKWLFWLGISLLIAVILHRARART